MSDDFRRRRRLTPEGPRRSSHGGGGMNPWLITALAALAVIVGGWFLGQALAHAFGTRTSSSTVAVAESPTAPASPTALPSPSAPPRTSAPKPVLAQTKKPEPSATPQPSPTVQVVTAPPSTPTPLPTAAPKTTIEPHPPAPRTMVPRPPVPAASAPQNPGGDVVRAYIGALERGDPQTAATYLANGTPDESFIDANTRITSITSTDNGDGTYKVRADLQTSGGEYVETFTVASGKILDKTETKP
jgi:hypothetical protein